MLRLCLHLVNWNISIYTKTETYGFDSPNGKNPVQNKLPLKKRERQRQRERNPNNFRERFFTNNCRHLYKLKLTSDKIKCFGQQTHFYQSLHNHSLIRVGNFFQQDFLSILWYQWYLIASLSFNSLPAMSPTSLCIIFPGTDARLMCLCLLEQSHLSPWTQEQQWAFPPPLSGTVSLFQDPWNSKRNSSEPSSASIF